MDRFAHAHGASVVSDAVAKRPRTFQCKDALWSDLERIAGDLECTVDYLVNDALKHYIRQRLTRRSDPDPASISPLTPSGQYPPPLPPLPPLRPPPPSPLHLAPPPLPPPPLPARMSALPTPRLPPPRTTALRPVAPPPYPAPPARVPPPLPQAPQLALSHGGRTCVVDRPGFVIGRVKASGLMIKDPNVSRQHAVIEEQAGVHYLVDLGSVNGTFVNGERIARWALRDGDVARICDHEIRFSFVGGPGL